MIGRRAGALLPACAMLTLAAPARTYWHRPRSPSNTRFYLRPLSPEASTRLVGSHSCGTGADGKKPERGSQPQPEKN